MVPFALVTLAAATSAAAEADAVAAATMNADRSPETLLGDDTPVDLSGSTPELGDRRTLAKKCNPKKNTECCRAPRRTPPRAAPPATHRGRRSTLLMYPLPPAGDKKSKCAKWVKKKPTKCAKNGFRGKCRASCHEHWGPISEIEFCHGPAYAGSPKDLRAQMGGAPARPKKPPAGSVDWTTGVPCACTQYRDGATAEDAATTGLCQRKQPEYDGLGVLQYWTWPLPRHAGRRRGRCWRRMRRRQRRRRERRRWREWRRPRTQEEEGCFGGDANSTVQYPS